MTERKTRVLMLDDERFLLEVYKKSFEKNGYEVYTYYHVDDALSALRQGLGPDVILFDITMPEIKSGYEFIETVKNEKLAKHSLKLALTNEGQEGEITRTKELGANDHLIKSEYIPSELVEKVTQMLKTKKNWFTF